MFKTNPLVCLSSPFNIYSACQSVLVNNVIDRGDGDKRPAAADRGRDRDEAEDRPTTTPSHLQPPVTSHIMYVHVFSFSRLLPFYL